jgi:hypothetical protein
MTRLVTHDLLAGDLAKTLGRGVAVITLSKMREAMLEELGYARPMSFVDIGRTLDKDRKAAAVRIWSRCLAQPRH